MAHFAELDENNIVLKVIVLENEKLLDNNGVELEQKGIDWLNEFIGNARWIQTSYNHTFRGRYATVGGYYDEQRDIFIPPKPELFPSWIINYNTCLWEPPIPCPENYTPENWPENEGSYTENHGFRWDEQSISWILFKIEDSNSIINFEEA